MSDSIRNTYDVIVKDCVVVRLEARSDDEALAAAMRFYGEGASVRRTKENPFDPPSRARRA